jgi:site-specific recombinase
LYKDVHNLLERVCPSPKSMEDAHPLIQILKENQQRDARWMVSIKIDHQLRLESLIWSFPDSVAGLHTYGDVVLIDSTLRKNPFNLTLCVLIFVDSEGFLRIGVRFANC